MKRHAFIIIFSVFIVNSFAQKAAPTTQEEYNYLTKGLKMQLEGGLDMKKGYSFSNIEKIVDGTRSLEVKGLMRDGEKKPCAISLIYTNTSYSKESFFLCLPTPDSPVELWNSFYASTITWSAETGRWMSFYLGRMLMSCANK